MIMSGPTWFDHRISFVFRCFTILAVAQIALSCFADEGVYLRDIKPIFRERCYACHGALKQESGLRLDTVAAMLSGGDSGPVITRGAPVTSLLLERIAADATDERMPPEGEPLSLEQIESIRTWIAGGAIAPEDELPEDAPTNHWAFQPPVAANVPSVAGQQGGNPIDAFLAAQRDAHGHSVVGDVEKNLLTRRVYLDLVGFPPLATELREFLADNRADAFERLVDRLLASPHYGQRWGRHWMDVWRYSDWYGLGEQLRNSQKHIWHWRDWIITSLNEDKGYDRMIVEMLAGDELAPTDQDTLRATGFLARNYYLFNRTTWLDTTIEHTSKAFLGLTMNCAKCHDHKYDPITHADYYRLRAIFEPHQVRLDPVPGEIELERDGIPRVFDAHPAAPTYVHVRGDAKNADKSNPLRASVPEFLTFASLEPQPIDLPLEAHWPSGQTFVLRDRLRGANDELQRALRALTEIERLSPPAVTRGEAKEQPGTETNSASDSTPDAEPSPDDETTAHLQVAKQELAAAALHPQQLLTAYEADRAKARGTANVDDLVAAAASAARRRELALAEAELARLELVALKNDKDNKEKSRQQLEHASQKVVAARKLLENPGTRYTSLRASRKALEGPAETEESRHQPYPKQSTGRRLAFARWLTHPDNPLTARVAVNHIWLRHFGQPLVESVTDFGRRAQRPQQQELLDWLAVELMRNGWRMKPLHRLMVTSQVYRLSTEAGQVSESARLHDPENHFYWRRKPIRMEAQVIRDSLLRLAGKLDATMNGPSIDPKTAGTTFRRSLYFKHSRDDQHKLLTMFDDADIFRCYRRAESVLPQQALALANSRLSLELASHVAERLSLAMRMPRESGDFDTDFTRRAFELILCRQPTGEERNACLQALAKWRRLPAEDAAVAANTVPREYRNLVHALLNHNDFITIR